MKAEKRHQLQTNVLADSVGRLLQGMKSAPRTRSTLVWVFVVLAVGTIILWRYGVYASLGHYSALWSEVDNASRDPQNGPSKLVQIGDENRGTLPGRTARFEVARLYLQSGQAGIRAVWERNDAVKRIYQALRLYRKLVKDCLDSPLLTQEAMMGIAQAEESLVSIPTKTVLAKDTDTPDPDDPQAFDLQRALASYEQLAKLYPDSPLGKEADNRAREIEKDRAGIEKFYADLNAWASRSKDAFPEPKFDLSPLTPPPPSPVPVPGAAGPDLPAPKPAPGSEAKPSGSKPAPSIPAPKVETKAPAPSNNAKTPPARADSKDSKSK